MELVYLWVEEYKNIKRQGFNFSPRFRCEFKAEYEKDKDGNEVLKDDCELIIDDEKDYVSIFPENINITAIVGENGSGKSAILEILHKKNLKENGIKSYFILSKKNNKYLSWGSIKDFQSNKTCSRMCHEIVESSIKLVNNETTEAHYSLPFFNGSYSQFQKSDKKAPLNSHANIFIPKYVSKFKSIITFTRLSNAFYFFDTLVLKIFDKDKMTNEFKEKYEEKIIDNKLELKINNLKDTDLEFLSKFQSFTYSDDIKDVTPLFDLDMLNSYNRCKYSSISNGEKQFLRLLIELMTHKESFISERKNFLFDEFENHLHPEWQKKVIWEIIELIKNLKLININLIFTSHSPFILSDIPKENVIFLEKDEKTGNCINTTDKMKDFNTFGANIHTLLSHGFFMKDGLMGEFAKSKIERIKRFYDFTTKYKNRIFSKEKIHLRIEKYYKSNKKEFDYIVSIIGEPFLQKVIKNYLDELEEIFDKENYKQKRLKKLLEEFGEDTVRKFLDND